LRGRGGPGPSREDLLADGFAFVPRSAGLGGRPGRRRLPGWLLGVPLCACFAACGGAAASGTAPTASIDPPQPASSIEDDFPVDASASRYHPMHHAAFGPLYGSGCPENGKCGCGGATGLAQEFTCQMDHLAANDIPVTAYLFDGAAWSLGQSTPDGTCSGPDCCSWKLGDQVIQRLASSGVRGLLHFWGGCHSDEQYGRAYSRLGRNLLGFYLDDGSSDDELQRVSEYMQSVIPGDWEVVAKAYQNREPSTTNAGLSKWANAAYVGDLPYDFDGLKQAIDLMVAKNHYLPAPFAELTGYAYLDEGIPDEEVYYRRLHFGAMQPVMAHTPYANTDPWRPEYGSGLVAAYRYWAWLHRELVPYFYSYAYRMYESPNLAVFWRGPMTYSLRVGRELFVPFVTEETRSMDVQLPSGQWIDYWDESNLVSGTLAGFPVPLGHEPVFIRQGAIIPMEVERPYTGHGTRESRGSLTVLVYPSGTSSFRYREDARQTWIILTSALAGTELTLTADPGLPAQPLLYRVGRWSEEPGSVGISGAQVTVNQGGHVPRLDSEAAVNGSTQSGWFYDAGAERLVIKVVP
jgi:hypothetical protein